MDGQQMYDAHRMEVAIAPGGRCMQVGAPTVHLLAAACASAPAACICGAEQFAQNRRNAGADRLGSGPLERYHQLAAYGRETWRAVGGLSAVLVSRLPGTCCSKGRRGSLCRAVVLTFGLGADL
jgi:hypothetical protein